MQQKKEQNEKLDKKKQYKVSISVYQEKYVQKLCPECEQA